MSYDIDLDPIDVYPGIQPYYGSWWDGTSVWGSNWEYWSPASNPSFNSIVFFDYTNITDTYNQHYTSEYFNPNQPERQVLAQLQQNDPKAQENFNRMMSEGESPFLMSKDGKEMLITRGEPRMGPDGYGNTIISSDQLMVYKLGDNYRNIDPLDEAVRSRQDGTMEIIPKVGN